MSEVVFKAQDVSEDEVSSIIDSLSKELDDRDQFILWMDGEMGAGKTALVRRFLQAKGLDERTPVISPTYTIVNEYAIADELYAHLDLYRAEENFSFAELGLRDITEYKGVFVEWPQRASETSENLEATHSIEISYPSEGIESRSYRFKRH